MDLKIQVLLVVSVLWSAPFFAQNKVNDSLNYASFINHQKSFARPAEAFAAKEDTLKMQFKKKRLKWPANYIYLRSFKYDSQLEVWVKNNLEDTFSFFKSYKVCALAGSLGPKRLEGDFQVPEGFYYINEFNPNSSFHLSLGINYPNTSDRILSDSLLPGGDIYIHGSCVTTGCIPITDDYISELYILATHAKNQGQDFIPLHIFPIKFDVKKSKEYLDNYLLNKPELKKFEQTMSEAYYIFNKTRQPPVVLINDNGEYQLGNSLEILMLSDKEVKEIKLRNPRPVLRTRNIASLPEPIYKAPQFNGGFDAFTQFVEKFESRIAPLLPEGIDKAYVQVEFIIDSDGVPVNFKVLKGIEDEEFIDELLVELESMPKWIPAIANDKYVAKKMLQSFTFERKD